MADGYPAEPGASLTKTQPGLGLSASRSPRGPKVQIAAQKPDIAHLPLTSPGGIVMSGGYLGRDTRSDE